MPPWLSGGAGHASSQNTFLWWFPTPPFPTPSPIQSLAQPPTPPPRALPSSRWLLGDLNKGGQRLSRQGAAAPHPWLQPRTDTARSLVMPTVGAGGTGRGCQCPPPSLLGRRSHLSPWASAEGAQSWSSGLQARLRPCVSRVSLCICLLICKTGKVDARPKAGAAEGSSTPWALPRCSIWLVWASWSILRCPPPPRLPLPHRPWQADTRPAAPSTPGAVLRIPRDHTSHSWSGSVLTGPLGRAGLWKPWGRKGRGEMAQGFHTQLEDRWPWAQPWRQHLSLGGPDPADSPLKHRAWSHAPSCSLPFGHGPRLQFWKCRSNRPRGMPSPEGLDSESRVRVQQVPTWSSLCNTCPTLPGHAAAWRRLREREAALVSPFEGLQSRPGRQT